ncbi:ParB-like protein [Idiomarina sp. Sol25]|uniref:ParB-like protein n=1 Tax=Idiomarina sp. Sol25 TaxID=3064000 RepID=UPI00294B2553|nr:ParB-like protein [Idiomarina sp. Sol25]MDV6328140.1 ParB-like protein [Idiomarina sp. Sol25]
MLRFFVVVWFLFSSANAEEVKLRISQLHPTQAVISHDQVANKIAKYKRDDKAFQKDLSEEPFKTAVLGPEGRYYLTDGHHTFSAMVEFSPRGDEQQVTVEITADKSSLSETDFWQWLKDTHQTWLHDSNGQPISHKAIPETVGRNRLDDDPVRGAMYFLRGHYLEKPENPIPFLEFYWANYLRQHTALSTPPETRTALNDARWYAALGNFIAEIPSQTPIGPNGESAKVMGQLEIPQYSQPVIDISGYSKNETTWPAIVEIPAGSRQKWQINKHQTDMLEWEMEGDVQQPRYIDYLGYPANYGAIPGTLSDKKSGGDGDPLDVLILGEALPRGIEVPVRIIGRMTMLDNNERDNKFIAVVPEQPPFGHISSVTQLKTEFPGVTDIFRTWFTNYKGKGNRATQLGVDDQVP